MIDVSDGFGIDLRRLAEASGVGVVLDELPVAPGATPDEALGGGEDYELVFTAPDPGAVAARFAESGLRAPVPVGTTTADVAEFLLRGVPLASTGYEHRLG
jgi:thiamine-monophosphate kinase